MAVVPLLLGIFIIFLILAGKYFQAPGIMILIIVFTSYIYQRYAAKEINMDFRLEDKWTKLINASRFIIVAGMLGAILAKIIGIFFPEFE